MATLPPTRNVGLIISNVNVPGTCCFCGNKDGVLRCSHCKAVQYCGEECQNKGWGNHKTNCAAIRQKIQDTTTAIYALANRYGGTAALLETPLVKRGQFRFPSSFEVALGENFRRLTLGSTSVYILARWSLAEAYAKCGQETSSRIAFRLAGENFLDLLRLTRNGPFPFVFHLKGCSWMVAGGMDQIALNLTCYFARNGRAPNPFLYSDEDIEGASCITAVQEILFQLENTEFSEIFFQTFMLISLIKFKRLQSILIESRKEDARWSAFMEGTHPETGSLSEVLRLAGVVLVTEKLKEFVVDQTNIERVALLAEQINGLLKSVNERNPKLINGVIDRQTLVHPDWDELELKFAISYGHVWHMDREYIEALRLFLDTGNVMDTSNVNAEEKDTGHEQAEEDCTRNMMANVMSVENDAGHVKAEEDVMTEDTRQ